MPTSRHSIDDGGASHSEAEAVVSVIIRTTGRDTLDTALDSVRRQHYPHLEVVLVDATGNKADDTLDDRLRSAGDIPCILVTHNEALNRPRAANAGLDRASGDFILFLDDDDWIADNHIEQLAHVLLSHDDIGVAYSSVIKTTETGTPTEDFFGKAFRPATLRHDNFIPIHAALIRHSLLEDGIRFDTSLDIFEDWDFWLELSCRTQFHHHDIFTAYYRSGGDSQTGSDNAGHRYQRGHPIANGREQLFDKWLRRWTGRDYNEALGDIDKEQELTAELEKLNQEIRKISKDLERREAELLSARSHIAELEQQMNRIFHSFSWKITRPLRGLKRGLTLLSPRHGGSHRSSEKDSNSADE